MSGYEPVPELMTAKAQYDAGEITSLNYYNIIRNQHFIANLELLSMLKRIASENVKISAYAAPYVEAVHNNIFDIKSDIKIPTVSETLQKIKNDLGIDFSGESARKTKLSSQSKTADPMVTIGGSVAWRDADGNLQPAKFIEIWILDANNDTFLAGDDNNPIYTDENGYFSIEISNGASLYTGGYDIYVSAVAKGSNIIVHQLLHLIKYIIT